jgi:hypothetical protein
MTHSLPEAFRKELHHILKAFGCPKSTCPGLEQGCCQYSGEKYKILIRSSHPKLPPIDIGGKRRGSRTRGTSIRIACPVLAGEHRAATLARAG